MLIESRRAARPAERITRASAPMTTGQVAFLLLVMWDLLVLGLIITAVTPFWLAPEYVLGSLRNIFAILQLVSPPAIVKIRF